MDTTSRDKWQVRAAALVIFLLGAAAGILAPHAYHGWLMREASSSRPSVRDVLERLQLNADQKTQVQQIFNDTHEQLRALHRDAESRVAVIRQQADERLQKVLTPEQWQRFQQEREEMHAQRRHGRGADRSSGDPHQAQPPPANTPAP